MRSGGTRTPANLLSITWTRSTEKQLYGGFYQGHQAWRNDGSSYEQKRTFQSLRNEWHRWCILLVSICVSTGKNKKMIFHHVHEIPCTMPGYRTNFFSFRGVVSSSNIDILILWGPAILFDCLSFILFTMKFPLTSHQSSVLNKIEQTPLKGSVTLRILKIWNF